MNTVPTPVLPESITPAPASVDWSQFQAAEGEITYWRNCIRSLQQNLRNINIPYEGAPSLHSSPPPLPASPPAASPPALSPTSNAQSQLHAPPVPPSSPLASPRLCLSISQCREQFAESRFAGDRDSRSTTGPAVSWEVFSKAFCDEIDPEERKRQPEELQEQISQNTVRQPQQENLHQPRTNFRQDKERLGVFPYNGYEVVENTLLRMSTDE
ncbi:hypothetical protein BDD12DRAFT_891541 [Trichophaea hybrida]|nr:hypothetical protein BDD12DRAFT_891541 [Trichophaea hybrida]